MDARTALWAGAGTAAVVAVAMTCGVALSSARALADRPGTVLAGTAVVVHGDPGSTADPVPPADDAPETVSAPAPKDIGSTRDIVTAEPPASATRETTRETSTGGEAEGNASTPEDATEHASSDGGAKADEPASTHAPQTDTAESGTDHDKAESADKAAKIREKLRELAERWEKRLAERTGRYVPHTDEWTSVRRTDEHSGSGHPRLRSGPEKEQSPRSPDNGD